MNEKIVIDKDSLKKIIKDTVKETMLEIATSDNEKFIEFLEDALFITLADNNKYREYINDKEFDKIIKIEINKEIKRILQIREDIEFGKIIKKSQNDLNNKEVSAEKIFAILDN